MNIITLPAGFTGNIASTAQSFFSDMSGVTTLIVGLLLGVIVIGILVRMFSHH